MNNLMHKINDIEKVIELIRQIDEKVDFSRSDVQWRILIALYFYGTSTTSEIAGTIGINKKATIDGIRKLIKKGLVVRGGNETYELTSEGRKVIEMLEELMSQEYSIKVRGDDDDLMIDKALNPIHYFYLIELLKAAIVNNNVVPIKNLSLELNVSENTIKNYLDLFTTKYKLFKRVSKKKLFGGISYSYVLTNEAIKISNKIPEIVKMKKNIFLKILLKMTKSIKFDIALMKLMIIQALGEVIILITDNQFFLIAWAIFITITSTIASLAYLYSKIQRL
jgi:predicted transcriptional regulator